MKEKIRFWVNWFFNHDMGKWWVDDRWLYGRKNYSDINPRLPDIGQRFSTLERLRFRQYVSAKSAGFLYEKGDDPQ